MVNKIIKNKLKHVKHKNTSLAVLYCLHIGSDLKLLRHCQVEIAELISLGMIEQVNGVPSLVHSFYEKDSAALPKEKTVNPSKAKKILNKSVEKWIEEYRGLFPKGVKSTGLDYPVRGDRIQCIFRMKNFLVEYGYSKEIILKATEMYIKEQKAKGWHMTKKSHKFIKDMNGSVLSEYCELIETGESTENKSHIKIV